jgi:hypothetical protein
MSLNRGRVRVCMRCAAGVVGQSRTLVQGGREVTKLMPSRTTLERAAKEGDSPVGERF